MIKGGNLDYYACQESQINVYLGSGQHLWMRERAILQGMPPFVLKDLGVDSPCNKDVLLLYGVTPSTPQVALRTLRMTLRGSEDVTSSVNPSSVGNCHGR